MASFAAGGSYELGRARHDQSATDLANCGFHLVATAAGKGNLDGPVSGTRA